jgi:hypothetical protein
MTSRQKTKGNTWEREIATDLSKRYNTTFIRTPSSGAYIGGKNSHRISNMDTGQAQGFKGDIIPPTEWQYFNCEAKSYKSFPFHRIYGSEIKILDTWIAQLMQVSSPDDLNIIFIKITSIGKFIVVQKKCKWNCDTSYSNYVSSKFGNWQVFLYDEFLKANLNRIEFIAKNGMHDLSNFNA